MRLPCLGSLQSGFDHLLCGKIADSDTQWTTGPWQTHPGEFIIDGRLPNGLGVRWDLSNGIMIGLLSEHLPLGKRYVQKREEN